MVDHTVGRVLDLFDLEAGLVERWSGAARSGHADVVALASSPKSKVAP
jgi:hypothetical protein